MKYRISICILLCLAILACGQAAAQQTYGTKVQSGDSDVGLPLSTFAPIPAGNPGATTQNLAYISYWDVGATPGIYDDQDVVYLQFGSAVGGANRIVRANNIRITGWGIYPAGSYVNQGDSDMGQQIYPWTPPIANPTAFASGLNTGFYYMNVVAGAGYDIGDPIYLKTEANPFPPASTNTNDIRITANAGFPAGSRVSLSDPDAARPLSPFDWAPALWTAAGGPQNQIPAIGRPIARLSFYNANGNVQGLSFAIYDTGDVVYFDVNPIGTVSPNDVRLY